MTHDQITDAALSTIGDAMARARVMHPSDPEAAARDMFRRLAGQGFELRLVEDKPCVFVRGVKA
jgi:hypothetical protein